MCSSSRGMRSADKRKAFRFLSSPDNDSARFLGYKRLSRANNEICRLRNKPRRACTLVCACIPLCNKTTVHLVTRRVPKKKTGAQYPDYACYLTIAGRGRESVDKHRPVSRRGIDTIRNIVDMLI